MSLFHAVVYIDHESAKVFEFDATQVVERKLHEHNHATRQHASSVRSQHEFFGSVCDGLEGISEVLVTGHQTGLADFRHYVEKHRPAIAPRLVGYERVDQPTDHQLVALAREFFVRYDQMAGSAGARPHG